MAAHMTAPRPLTSGQVDGRRPQSHPELAEAGQGAAVRCGAPCGTRMIIIESHPQATNQPLHSMPRSLYDQVIVRQSTSPSHSMPLPSAGPSSSVQGRVPLDR